MDEWQWLGIKVIGMIIIITCLIVFPLDLVSFSYTKLFVTCNIYSNTFKVFNDKTNKYISTLKPWIQSNNQTIMFYIHFCFEISTRWRPLSKLTSKQSVLWKKNGFSELLPLHFKKFCPSPRTCSLTLVFDLLYICVLLKPHCGSYRSV